jgi:small subunit ribosomal protein S4
MGQPRKIRKIYSRPLKRWDSARIDEEEIITQNYGLKNKSEILKAQEKIRTFRRTAKKLLSMTPEEAAKIKEELMNKLSRLGLLEKDATSDEVLGLKEVDIMNRRLQTIVYRKGLSKTMKQARQMITHGKILVDGRRNTSPGTLITKNMEGKIKSTMKLVEPKTPVIKPKPKEEAPEEKKEVKPEGKKESSETEKKEEKK